MLVPCFKDSAKYSPNDNEVFEDGLKQEIQWNCPLGTPLLCFALLLKECIGIEVLYADCFYSPHPSFLW